MEKMKFCLLTFQAIYGSPKMRGHAESSGPLNPSRSRCNTVSASAGWRSTGLQE